jgi:Flp pilus assembly protein TadD
MKAKREGEAAAEYAVYLSLKPDDPVGHIGAGAAAIELGDEAAAARHFDRAAALDPRNAQVYQKRANAAVRRGNLEAALVELDRAVALEPYDLQIRYSRGMVLARLGRTKEARAENVIANQLRADDERLTSLKHRLAKSPDDRDLQSQVAQWLFDHGEPEEGVRWAQKVIKEQPNHPRASRQLADYYEKKGNRGLANFYRLEASTTSRNP